MEALAAPVATICRSSTSAVRTHRKATTASVVCSSLSLPSFPGGNHHHSHFPVFFSSRNNSFSGRHGGSSESEDPSSPDSENHTLIPLFKDKVSFSRLSKDEAMGLVLSAARRGWTTDSGMEGPPIPAGANEPESGAPQVSTFPWSLFTKSPRRRMRVAFTCNVCGQRTTRAINPHAYTDGTVFVQCAGCNIFHKLVDNLNLFHEVKGFVDPKFKNKNPMDDLPFNYLDMDDFPLP
ncbi:DNL-type zinc finger protein [Nymphaea thermarum]|nr:DNL-type zinc finger protein [Nymphaea thermarum]